MSATVAVAVASNVTQVTTPNDAANDTGAMVDLNTDKIDPIAIVKWGLKVARKKGFEKDFKAWYRDARKSGNDPFNAVWSALHDRAFLHCVD